MRLEVRYVTEFRQFIKKQAVLRHVSNNIEEAKVVIDDFIERYSAEWLLQRLLYCSPKEGKMS